MRQGKKLVMIPSIVEELCTQYRQKMLRDRDMIVDPPIHPTNSILMPSWTSFLPSLVLITTCPLTLSPSKYTGHFSLLSFSTFTSTCLRPSSPSNRISTSTGDEKLKKEAMYMALAGALAKGYLG